MVSPLLLAISTLCGSVRCGCDGSILVESWELGENNGGHLWISSLPKNGDSQANRLNNKLWTQRIDSWILVGPMPRKTSIFSVVAAYMRLLLRFPTLHKHKTSAFRGF